MDITNKYHNGKYIKSQILAIINVILEALPKSLVNGRQDIEQIINGS